MLIAEFWLLIVEVQSRFEYFLPILCRKELKDRPCYRLSGNHVPRIDFCVLACGEATDFLIDTIAAAAAQDYPPASITLFLLDDGRSRELKNRVRDFNCKQRQCGRKEIIYRSREKIPGVPTHFKAGNLNYGLQQTQRISGADYVAALDADMIVKPDWLRAVVPHLILDDQVAVATPPQVGSFMED